MRRNQEIVAHAEIQSQPAVHFPVVLEVRLEVRATPMPKAVPAHLDAVKIQRPFLVLSDAAQVHIRQGVAGSDGIAVVENEIALRVEAALLPELELLKKEPELQRVASFRPGHIVLIDVDGLCVVVAHEITVIYVEAGGRSAVHGNARKFLVAGVRRN